MDRFLRSATATVARRLFLTLGVLTWACAPAAIGQAPAPQYQQGNPAYVPPANARPNPPAPVPPAAGNQWDPALRVLDEASRTFQNTRDYSCTFIKREVVQGRLQ